MKKLADLKVKLFADGAEKKSMLEMHAHPLIKGFTTNPTLMRKAGLTDYEAFAREILAVITDRPISFEVFADDFAEMERQARLIAKWASNVFVKIPVTNTQRESAAGLIRKLSHDGIQVNVTAILTLQQVSEVVDALAGGAASNVSVFAGRVADTGVDPVPHMRKAVEMLQPHPQMELIWASPRELLNVFQADAVGCHIITATTDILKKLNLVDKDLGDYSLETVKMFADDAESPASGYDGFAVSTAHQAFAAVLSLWVAVLALAFLVTRELGWGKVKRHWFAMLILIGALLALPFGGALKVAMPYKPRIMALFTRTTMPAIESASGCKVFPDNNIWNRAISALPVDPNSSRYIASMGADLPLHADFGVVGGIGYAVTNGPQPVTQVSLASPGESDAGPYSIPDSAPVEGGTDSHVLVLDSTQCKLYELFAAHKIASGQWEAGSGAIFDLRGNKLRTEGFTSADAAGLPILAGLVRYEEIKAGKIGHAIRFTTRNTQRAFVWPARHYASLSKDTGLPPMGQRFRLRSTFDVSSYSPDSQILLTALKEYGMMLSDNGGPWYITGAPDYRWTSKVIGELKRVKGSDFEAVDVSGLMIDRNSAEARQ